MNIGQIKPGQNITAEFLNKLAQQSNVGPGAFITGHGPYNRNFNNQGDEFLLGVIWQVQDESQRTFRGIFYDIHGFIYLDEETDYSAISNTIFCPTADWEYVDINNHFLAVRKKINNTQYGYVAVAVYGDGVVESLLTETNPTFPTDEFITLTVPDEPIYPPDPPIIPYETETIPDETIPDETIPIESLESVPDETMPIDTVDSLESKPVETFPIDTFATSQTFPIDTIDSLESKPVETFPIDTFATTGTESMESIDSKPIDTIPIDTFATDTTSTSQTVMTSQTQETTETFEFCGDGCVENLPYKIKIEYEGSYELLSDPEFGRSASYSGILTRQWDEFNNQWSNQYRGQCEIISDFSPYEEADVFLEFCFTVTIDSEPLKYMVVRGAGIWEGTSYPGVLSYMGSMIGNASRKCRGWVDDDHNGPAILPGTKDKCVLPYSTTVSGTFDDAMAPTGCNELYSTTESITLTAESDPYPEEE